MLAEIVLEVDEVVGIGELSEGVDCLVLQLAAVLYEVFLLLQRLLVLLLLLPHLLERGKNALVGPRVQIDFLFIATFVFQSLAIAIDIAAWLCCDNLLTYLRLDD